MLERFVQKEYYLCNTNEWMRKLQTKIHHRSSTWKQQEVQLLCWMNFRWKTFKIIASMKRWSTRETCVLTTSFHPYITCSITVNGWRVTSSGWRPTSKKNHVKNRVKFRYTCREVEVLHAVHFRRICFAIKAERMIPPFSKLLENG